MSDDQSTAKQVTPGLTDQTNNDTSKQIMLTDHLADLYSKWTESHPGQKAPIVLDSTGNPLWVNRAQRRRMAHNAKKARK